MRSKYILFALALTGALASCSDDDNNKKPVYNNPYSNPLTNYSAADPTVWKENDHSFYVYATNTSVIRKSTDLIHWTDVVKCLRRNLRLLLNLVRQYGLRTLRRLVINTFCIMLCLLWVNLHLPALELLLQILPKVPSHWIYLLMERVSYLLQMRLM